MQSRACTWSGQNGDKQMLKLDMLATHHEATAGWQAMGAGAPGLGAHGEVS